MTRYRKITTICCAAVFALGLAACGGGGNDGLNTSQEQELQNQVTTLQGQINALREQLGLAADDNLSDSVADLRRELNDLKLQMQNAKDTADAEAMTAKAKALKKAIMAVGSQTVTMAGGKINISAVNNAAGTALDPQPNGLTDLAKQSASIPAMGNWMGADYMKDTGTGAAKVTAMARTYSNTERATGVPFVGEAGAAIHSLSQLTADDGKDVYSAPATASTDIAGTMFPTTGTQAYEGDKRKFGGTFMGASGTYQCPSSVAANGCTANATPAGIILVGGWTFTPSPGAMVQQKDSDYLQFGWWVRKDKDGPTHAGAFYRASSATLTAVTGAVIDGATIQGKATYTGSAAGKFAISDPLRPANDNAGHFTADATLMADFKDSSGGGDGSTLSGTINNFRLNDGSADPGWSVALQKTGLTTDTFTSVGNDDAATVWSIGDGKGAAAGKWEAQMYNDRMKGDGNTTPHSVAGSFMSVLGSTHEMVGAFGAQRQ